MANEQHIEWLCEGIKAWNERRKRETFTPDFSFATDLPQRLRSAAIERGAGYRDRSDPNLGGKFFDMANLWGVDLVGANLEGANLKNVFFGFAVLTGADLQEADLEEADFREADLRGANLGKARLARANLRKAILWDANLAEAELVGVDLRETELWGTSLERANLQGAKLGGTHALSIAPYETKDESIAPEPTDLSSTLGLSQRQLDLMRGDRWTLIPSHLERPTHWLSEDPQPALAPRLPENPAHQRVDLTGDLKLSADTAHSAPNRSDLEALYADLRDSIEDLRLSGGLGNLSPLLSKGCDRFFGQLPESFIELDDVRFAVGSETLRIRVEAERAILACEAPEKIGHLDAVLYTADLITARLPGWIAFLQEEADVKPVFEARTEEAASILEDAADGLAQEPERFDTSLFERIREYLESKTIEGYLAAKDLLVAIAHKTFSLVSNITRDVVSEARKLAIKGIAGALVVQLGSALLKLAGLLPRELDWILRWLEYLPKVL